MKTCNKCKIDKDINDFYKSKNTKDGLQYICKQCDKQYSLCNKDLKKEKNKEYYLSHIEEKKGNYISNRDEVINKSKKRYLIKKDEIKEYNRSYFLNNKEFLYENLKKRYYNDPLFRLSNNIRNLINQSFKKQGYYKNCRTHEVLCCSFEEFKLYFESKFESWMNWENKGLYNGQPNYGWDIDHIIPLSSANTEEEILKLNHFSNLQPLCSYINRDVKRNIINYKGI